MAIRLPIQFAERMKKMLGDEYELFVKSYDSAPHAGIRVNSLKIDPASFAEISPFPLKPIPWCETGYYIPAGSKPGLTPYYHAGLYYVQEPSAMAPVELLKAQPGDHVLDLCAAPGGKSTQIAADLKGRGILVTNDISTDRTKALAKNIEMYGVRNAVVLNESPERIADAFPHYFDKILIDAPCSGEGMFRKDEDMVRQWDHHSIERCVLMQRDILNTAARLLAPGGRLVYSTCTFAPEENEAMIGEFLLKNSSFRVVPIQHVSGISGGHPEWIEQAAAVHEFEGLQVEPVLQEEHPDLYAQLQGTGRLWPHLVEGEGHFVAVLQHDGTPLNEPADQPLYVHNTAEKEASHGRNALKKKQKHNVKHGGAKQRNRSDQMPVDAETVFREFVTEQLNVQLPGQTVLYGEKVYQTPVEPERLAGLRVIRAGWFMGSVKNGRFMPSQALASALNAEEAIRSVQLTVERGEAIKYLKGETLEIGEDRLVRSGTASSKGYTLVTVNGYSVGWAKWQEGRLKNEYPAGWRWTSV